MSIRIEKTHDHGIIPTAQTERSVGYDFSVPKVDRAVVIRPGQTVTFGLGIRQINGTGGDYYLEAHPRSSIRARGLTFLGTGIIDPDYDGEIQSIVHNTTNNTVALMPGERIGQFIIRPAVRSSAMPVINAERGTGGLGSTGRMA